MFVTTEINFGSGFICFYSYNQDSPNKNYLIFKSWMVAKHVQPSRQITTECTTDMERYFEGKKNCEIRKFPFFFQHTLYTTLLDCI